MTKSYGDRDAYRRGRTLLITRPDGSKFLQNHTESYRRTELPPVLPDPKRGSRMEGVDPPRPGRVVGAGEASEAVRVGRSLNPEGSVWFVEFRNPDGSLFEVAHPRSCRQGHG